MQTLNYYFQLLKFRLSFIVVFSSGIGYMLGVEDFVFSEFVILIIGGFLVTGSANSFNQILERNFDKLMSRTSKRPLPKNNISLHRAIIFSFVLAFLGLYLLNLIHPGNGPYSIISKSSFYGLVSIIIYVLLYTPLKRISTISIFVGAIPGAIPFMLGHVAATDSVSSFSLLLFFIQFLWQFPHFISISWVLDNEYKKAGFKMMYGGEKGKYPAVISLFTSILLFLSTLLPSFYSIEMFSLTIYSSFLVFFLGIWFCLQSYFLCSICDDTSAKKLMISSFFYLPLLQVVYVVDKYLF